MDDLHGHIYIYCDNLCFNKKNPARVSQVRLNLEWQLMMG